MTLIFFLIILLVLVLSHEAGHFFSARAFKIRVDEFGFGLPPRVWGIKRGQTLYSLNILPFGGFVKIFGEEGEEANQPESFGSKPARARALVLASGVFANILLAYFLFTALSAFGAPQLVDSEEIGLYPDAALTIIDIAPNSPAEKAGAIAGDRIEGFQKIEGFQNFVTENRGKNVSITLLRGKQKINIAAFVRENPPEGEGSLGVALGYVRVEKSSWYAAPIDGAKLTWQVLKGTIFGFWEILKNLAMRETANIQVAGPVGIFNITSSAISFGARTIFMLTAILSVNLAVINILPFPGLDGGRLFFLLIEAVRGRRISAKTSALAHSLGLAALILLMLAITYRDIARMF